MFSRPSRLVGLLLMVALPWLLYQLRVTLQPAAQPVRPAAAARSESRGLERARTVSGGLVRVACIGDSITEPAGHSSCGKQVTHYPCALKGLLGPRYDVRTFGCSKATGHNSGGKAWTRKCAAKRQAALSFAPHVVIALFGTNDAMPEFARDGQDAPVLGARLAADLNGTLQEFRALPSQQLLLLCLPPPQTRHTWYDPPLVGGLPLDDWREHAAALARIVVPALRGLAATLPLVTRRGCAPPAAAAPSDVALVDLTAAVPVDDRYFFDGLHPNGEGAALLAKAIEQALVARRPLASAPRLCAPCTATDLSAGPRCVEEER